MNQPCDIADGRALRAIGEAIAREAHLADGEARDGRKRLLQNINQKLVALGQSQVDATSATSRDNAFDLIQRGMEDTSLCAHTRNFLQVALSRLQRFDMLH